MINAEAIEKAKQLLDEERGNLAVLNCLYKGATNPSKELKGKLKESERKLCKLTNRHRFMLRLANGSALNVHCYRYEKSELLYRYCKDHSWEPAKVGAIYLARDSERKIIKIGFTTQLPSTRVKKLKYDRDRSFPFKGRLVKAYPGYLMDDEQLLHSNLERFRYGGREYYHDHPSTLFEIDRRLGHYLKLYKAESSSFVILNHAL